MRRPLGRRVVVTGMDCATPLGRDLASTWAGAVQGRSGISPRAKESKRRPGTDRVCLASGELRHGAADLGDQVAPCGDRGCGGRDGYRLADHDPHAGAAGDPRPRPQRVGRPDDRDRDERRTGRQRKPRRAPLPGPLIAAEHGPLREDRNRVAAFQHAHEGGDSREVAAPALEELAGQYKGKVKVAKVNIDDNQDTPQQYGVRSIPTLLLFKGGRVVDQIVGAVPKAKLEDAIKKVV